MYLFYSRTNTKFKMKIGIALLLYVYSLYVRVNCYSSADVRELISVLFSNYSATSDRPSADFNNEITIYLDFYLLTINSVDVVAQKMITTAYLEFLWFDEMLTWTPEDYNGIELFLRPQGYIWRPDITLRNGFTAFQELGSDFFLAEIHYNGLICWFPTAVFETKCFIDIKYFPFDRQVCDIELSSWMYYYLDMSIIKGQYGGIVLNRYSTNDEWYLESVKSSNLPWESYGPFDPDLVKITITVKRIPNYYIVNIVLPVLFLSMLISCTFVIPADSGEKMGYSMTVLLSFAVFLTIVGSSFPVSSSTSLISAYLVFLLAAGTIIVLITGIQLRLHHRDHHPKVPELGCKIVRLTQKMKCGRKVFFSCKRKSIVLSGTPTTTAGEEFDQNEKGTDFVDRKTATATADKDDISEAFNSVSDDDKDITWSDLVAAIDIIMFFVSFTLISVVTATVFVWLKLATM